MKVDKAEVPKIIPAGFQFDGEPKRAGTFAKLEAGSDKDLFIENLSLLLASGMDAVSALTAMRAEVKTRGMKQVIGDILLDIEGGLTLSKSLLKTGLFGVNVIALIKIGEESGNLPENLKVIAIQLQKEKTFRAKVASAMMYPVFVLSLTLIIGVSISWVILPRLANVFSQMHLKLPWITKILIDMGLFLSDWGYIFVPSFVGFFMLLIFFVFVYEKTKFVGQELLFMFPAVKNLIQQIELARLGFILGSLLTAGLPVVTAFDSLIDVSSFRSYRKMYQFLRDRIEEGNSFQKSFALYPGIDRLVPPSIQQMIAAAEQSGFLSSTLVKVGERFEEMTDITGKNLSTLLEPVLLVIVWLGVSGVALAVILPIYSLVGGFTQATQVPMPAPAVGIMTPTVTLMATPSAVPTVVNQVVVQTTGIGYLNVRQTPEVTGTLVGRVLPGEIYDYTDVRNGWYLISLPGGKIGWVIGQFVNEKH